MNWQNLKKVLLQSAIILNNELVTFFVIMINYCLLKIQFLYAKKVNLLALKVVYIIKLFDLK